MSLDNPLIATSALAATSRIGRTRLICLGAIAAIHVAALGVMLWTESGWVPPVLFLLSWAFLNFFFLLFVRRPAVSAAVSLLLVAVLVTLSHFKFTILWM